LSPLADILIRHLPDSKEGRGKIRQGGAAAPPTLRQQRPTLSKSEIV
jgi:hypothetical protein